MSVVVPVLAISLLIKRHHAKGNLLRQIQEDHSDVLIVASRDAEHLL